MKHLWMVLWGLLGPLAAAGAQERIAFDDATPPFMFLDGGGAGGLYPDLVKEAFRRMGVPVECLAVPWRRALADADRGQAAACGLYKTAERSAKYDYSAPLFEERLGLFVLKGKEFPFGGLDDLGGKRIGTRTGWSYGDAFDAAAKAGRVLADAETNSDLTGFQKLLSGRLDAVLAEVEAGEAAVRTLKAGGTVALLPRLYSSQAVYLAYAKAAGKTALLERFNRTVASMKLDGTYDRIVARAFGGR